MSNSTPEFIACFRKGGYGLNFKAKADFSKCCVEISDYKSSPRWPSYRQCSRANGHGPHGAYCKLHDPAAKAAKEEARSAKWRAEWDAKSRDDAFTREARQAIRDIAAGHNDPRGLAQSLIDKLNGAA